MDLIRHQDLVLSHFPGGLETLMTQEEFTLQDYTHTHTSYFLRLILLFK